MHTLSNSLFTIICSFEMVVTETYLNRPIINKSKLLVEIARVMFLYSHVYVSILFVSVLTSIHHIWLELKQLL